VGREDDSRALRNVGESVDEDGAARAQILDDVRVVDDLLADVDRATVERKRSFDRLNGPLDACAIASRRSEEETFHHVRATIAGQG
jgi:hypothetical protein